MKINIPYGKNDEIPIHVADEKVLQVVWPNNVSVTDETQTIIKGITHPYNAKSFADFLHNARNVLFIVNDATRPTPTAKVLEVIYDQIKDKDIKFIVATGVHREPDQEEFEFIFGRFYQMFKDKIHVHDARREQDMVYIGTSSHGTQMYINKLGVEAEKLVTISSVEPHYFAGYTGGRKSFLPGIASFKTIEQNHKCALHANAKALALDGNPVHEDMIDALQTVTGKEIFSIQTVLDKERRIYCCTAGDIHDSFLKAIAKAHEVYCVEIKNKADVVVTIAAYPMDIDLYQAQKAIENGKLALNKNGILILIAKCRTGIGERAFFELLAGSPTPEQALQKIERGYKLGYHKAAKMAELATWAEMWGVTGLDKKEAEAVFIKPFHDIQKAVDTALEKKGTKAKVLFLMDGCITVPKCGGAPHRGAG